MRYLYEIKDTITGRVLEHSVTVGEAAKILGCQKSTINYACINSYRINKRYILTPVYTVIPKNSPLWMEWELRRSWLLKIVKTEEKTNDSKL